MKHLYAVVTGFFCVMMTVMLALWHDGQPNMSTLANTTTSSFYFFIILTIILSVGIWMFLTRYFFAHVHASNAFVRLYATTLIFAVITTLIPYREEGSLSWNLHLLTGAIGFFASVGVFSWLAMHRGITLSLRIYIACAIVIGTAAFLLMETLLSQFLYVALAQSAILAVTYTRVDDRQGVVNEA